jgi:hypothetical protein
MVAAASMRAVALVVVAVPAMALGGRLLPFSVAFAQTPEAGAGAAGISSGASLDGGTDGEPQTDAAPDAAPMALGATRPEVDAAPPATPAPELAPPPRPAQMPPTAVYVHNGFYASASTGFGHVVATGSGPSGSAASISGLAMNFDSAIGGSPVPGLAIAFVAGGATRIASEFKGGPVVTATSTVGNVQGPPMALTGNARTSTFLLGLRADWFPVATGPWHVGLDVGLGGVSVTDDAGKTISGVSVAGSIFGGYQGWLGPGWSLGIAGVVSAAPSLNMVDSSNKDTGYSLAPVFLGVEFPIVYY